MIMNIGTSLTNEIMKKMVWDWKIGLSVGLCSNSSCLCPSVDGPKWPSVMIWVSYSQSLHQRHSQPVNYASAWAGNTWSRSTLKRNDVVGKRLVWALPQPATRGGNSDHPNEQSKKKNFISTAGTNLKAVTILIFYFLWIDTSWSIKHEFTCCILSGVRRKQLGHNWSPLMRPKCVKKTNTGKQKCRK